MSADVSSRHHDCQCECGSGECHCGADCAGNCHCCQNCHCHPHHFQRRYKTKAEKITELQAYLSELKQEIQAVEEMLKDLSQ